MKRRLAGLILLGCHGSALACLNDNELPSHEREFRSQYLVPVASRSARPEKRDGRRQFWFLTAGGTGLLSGAAAVALTIGRSRS
jgi:hypothetical protein